GNTELEILSGGQQFYFGQGSPGTGNPSFPDNGNPSASSTLLSFDTNDYRTRVYQLNNQVFMDVVDVRTSTFLMRQAPTAIAPQQQTAVASRTYAATQGPYQAFATVSSNRATELQLWSNGSQVYRANGFNPSGSDIGFNDSPSTGYMGNDFAVPTQAQITTRSANLRDRPSTTSSAVVATLLQCTEVTVTQKQYNTGDRYVWYFIDIRGQARGWIRGDLINTDVPSC
ncbi:MAG: SH3 domain-containing protein, partial [Leptolyngbyaceae bacterium]|nr:SH3 domain-containing protein [Leptolyngbyaceae bacterium]